MGEHGHNMDDNIQLKYVIEALIKKGMLSEYVKGGKWDRDESPKTKSPTKAFESRTDDKRRETNKEKHLYIATITSIAPWVYLPSKVSVKRKIAKMMAV